MFSQGKEEKFILDYFGDYVGAFLDIGSNDGVTLSNTHSLALNDWAGVCVEPSPKPFGDLCGLYLHRDDIYCLNVAVSNRNGKAKFYNSGSHLSLNDTGLLSSLHKEETTKWRPTTKFEEIEVDVVDFKTLLNLSPYKRFQFISCDAEGNDVIILRQMDLRKLECRLLCIEYNSVTENYIEINEILDRQGYELLHRNPENLLYNII